MKKILIYIYILFSPSILFADNLVNTIAATVGEDIISTQDLYNRINLTMSILDIEKSQTNADSLMPRVLQQLIDEKIILTQAKNLKIKVTEEELENTIKEVEEQNRSQSGKLSFKELLRKNNISPETAIEQIKAQILWGKLVAYAVRPKINISEIEVQEILNTATPERAEVTFKQILIPTSIFKNEAEVNKEILDLSILRNDVSSCSDMDIVTKRLPAGTEINTITLPISDIHKDLQNMIKTLPIGKVSKVIKSNQSLRIITVCSRDFTGLDNKSKEEVRDLLLQKRLIIEANHYIHNLRKKSFIEVYL